MSEITAIYENGILRPLTPLTFSEGQQVRLQVMPLSSSAEQIDRVLEPLVEAGLLTLPPGRGDVPTISEAQLRELTQSLQTTSGKPLSEIIIEDRGNL
jgi:predicted DNA-binding antitoxin AbrB/MazE fold protein